MPKTPSNKLFNLIKSLSGSEKRYFNLHVKNARSDKVNKYLQLFEAIDAQEEYDDEALRRLIYADEPIQSRKFSELKAYLYELVLKSLQGFDEKSSIDFRLKGFLQSVRVLYKRSHYEEAKELLQKAKKLALKYEAFHLLVEILNWTKQIAYAQADIPFLDKELEHIDQEERVCMEHLQNISAYKNIFYRIMISIRKDSLLRSEEKITKLDAVMDHPLLSDISQARSHRAKIIYYRTYGLYYISILQYDKLYQVSKEAIELMESKPYLLKEDVSEYISALSNFAFCCGLLERYEEVRACLRKFKAIRPNTRNDELRIHIEYYSKTFNLCIFTGEFEEAERALIEHEREMKGFDQSLFERGRFYFQYFYIHFGIGNYDKALHDLNRWLNMPRSIERQDLQSLARILNLIIHFEMGNVLLLDYILRSTYRFLRSRNRIFEFERRVLNFIRESNKIKTGKELRSAFIQLKTDFEELANIPSERVMFQYFDFIAWLESKITGEAFDRVVKQRFRDRLQKKGQPGA